MKAKVREGTEREAEMGKRKRLVFGGEIGRERIEQH